MTTIQLCILISAIMYATDKHVVCWLFGSLAFILWVSGGAS